MTHVPPERWADLARGRVPETEAAEMAAHATSCTRCARERARVDASQTTMKRLAAASPPSLSWDRVRAQLYWNVSSEASARRRRPRTRSSRALLATLSALAAAAVALTIILTRPRASDPSVHAHVLEPRPSPSPSPPPTPAPTVPPAALEGVVTLLQGEVRTTSAAVTADTPLRAGDSLIAGRGRLAVQVGPRTGFVLEPGARLDIVSLDAAAVVLRVSDGAVGVEVEERRPGQRFAVLAGARTIEVRGTVFRVAEHAGDVDVAVRRGRVIVGDEAASVEVGEGARLALARGVPAGGLVPERMLAAAAATLGESMRVPLVPGFGDAAGVRAATAMLAVTAAPRARVRVDGVEAGTGPFAIRRAPGRHIVESDAVARWVEVEAGVAAPVTLVERGRSERPGQLDGQLRAHRAAIGRCADSARKAAPGFAGDLEVEIGIHADGSIGFVAPVREGQTDAIADCVLDVIRQSFTFPTGTDATVRKVISF